MKQLRAQHAVFATFLSDGEVLRIIFQLLLQLIERLPAFIVIVDKFVEKALATRQAVSANIRSHLRGECVDAAGREDNILHRTLILDLSVGLMHQINQNADENQFERKRHTDQNESYLGYLEIKAHRRCSAGSAERPAC